MTTADLLARIDKLPKEWRHPLSNKHLPAGSWDEADIHAVALDLHLRHIAEKLAAASICIIQLSCGRWFHPAGLTLAQDYDTYAEALVSAAEAVGDSKEKNR